MTLERVLSVTVDDQSSSEVGVVACVIWVVSSSQKGSVSSVEVVESLSYVDSVVFEDSVVSLVWDVSVVGSVDSSSKNGSVGILVLCVPAVVSVSLGSVVERVG